MAPHVAAALGQENDADKTRRVIQRFSMFHANLSDETLKLWVEESGCCDRNSCIHDFKNIVLSCFVDAWHTHSTQIKADVLAGIVSTFGQTRTINTRQNETPARREERIEARLKLVVEEYLELQCGLNTMPRVVDTENAAARISTVRRPAYTQDHGYAVLHNILIQT